MKHVEIYIDEYLKGELPRSEAERVAAHLSGCDRCRRHAEWLRGLDTLADTARIEPPAEVLAGLGARLSAIPEGIDREEIDGRSGSDIILKDKTRVPMKRKPTQRGCSVFLLRA